MSKIDRWSNAFAFWLMNLVGEGMFLWLGIFWLLFLYVVLPFLAIVFSAWGLSVLLR